MRTGMLVTMFAAVSLTALPAQAQFAIADHPRVNPADFVVTKFADVLNYPVGMVELEDGSILVAVSDSDCLLIPFTGTCGHNSGSGSFFGSTSGQILRFVDTDDDGVADSRTVIEDGLTIGGPTALKKVDDLLFVTGQGKPIAILKLGPAPDYVLTELGRIFIADSRSWMHPHSALVARRAPGMSDTYELYFPLGSKVNFAPTTDTRALTSTIGLTAELAGDAIHRVTFTYDGSTIAGVDVIQIATGLRSASGLAFHPKTGDLYFEDNGIDGLVTAIEAHSADEINVIPADQIGGDIEYFGFPENHITYRTGEFAGGDGIPPLVAFTPLPNPADGSESEGPNEIAFAPPGFPSGLNDGLFVGFHGQFSRGGLSNEENPLVYVDLETGEYFHFVSNEEQLVGHLDGLLATGDRLYVSDISGQGGFGSSAQNSGAIYRIRYVGGGGMPTAVERVSSETPEGFALESAYPNPFNPNTTIRFTVPARGGPLPATLRVYDIAGQVVKTLVDETVTAGGYAATWDGTDEHLQPVASGMYVYRLQVGDRFTAAGRVTLLK